ncbi:MAG: TonB family protein [Flavisolibacter sp.]|nr:TonB family protein [Flavisolibacter sp.]
MVLKTRKLHPLLMKVFVFILLLFSLDSASQKLKTNGYDKYLRKWRIETYPVNLKSTPDIKMDISFASADTAFFLQLMGSGIGTNTVDKNSEVVFLLDNDSTVTVKSSSLQSIDYGNISPAYRHEYLISFSDIESLGQHNLQALRKYSIGGFDDIYIEKKNEVKLRALANFFITELKKVKPLPQKVILIPPGFPGGNDVLLNFLNRNLKLLPDLKVGENKTAVVQFMVAADGSITDLQVKQSAGIALDNELLRILKRMPEWKPALENGKGINYTITQPLKFYRTAAGLKIQF